MTDFIDDHLAQALLKRCALRDESALKALHGLMAQRLYAFVFHRLRDEDAARDIMVDTLYEAWKCAAKFRGESRVSTWIFGIARHKVMAHWRQTAAQPMHEDIDDHADVLIGDLEDGSLVMERWQEQKIVTMCLCELPPVQRECVQLVYLEGMTVYEVAAVQDVPVGTVQSRLFHARKNMRLCLQKNGGART